MFRDAISEVSKFTRPIHSISRLYNQTEVIPGAATLFFVNKDGWALTCKHVAGLIREAEVINSDYKKFKNQVDNLSQGKDYKTNREQIVSDFKYDSNKIVQLKYNFVNCVDTLKQMKFQVHPDYDLALIKFNGFKNLHCNHFPTFGKTNNLRQGQFLCRLGYPFPEFSNFKYDIVQDDIVWTKKGNQNTPIFPIEGMITRFIGNKKDIHGIEISRPGLKGQSGGPLFDVDGNIIGMQSSTKHLHLGFDIEEKEIRSNGQLKKVNDYSFLHLGQCIHGNIIKDFMKQNKVKFNEVT